MEMSSTVEFSDIINVNNVDESNRVFTARKRSLRRLCFYMCRLSHGGHVWQGGMHGGGREWQGVCMVGGMCAMHVPRQILKLRHTVNERAVRILLECILVAHNFLTHESGYIS